MKQEVVYLNKLNLREVDKLEVIVLVDNYTDALMESTTFASRPPLRMPRTPLAEHGLACLIKVFSGSEEHQILFDTGHSGNCISFNIDYMRLDARKIESIVISHGHVDHIEGLVEILNRVAKHTPVVLHPRAFLERRLNIKPTGQMLYTPFLKQNELQKKGINFIVSEKPSIIASDLVLVTGKVEREVEFEKGFPWAEARIDGEWVVDPFDDDQALAVKVKGKGLVVIGGCSHAGIINTVKYCQKITASTKVHAVMGGFHLNNKIFESIIHPTIEEMKKLNPDYIVPMHCTGWTAINEFAREMPAQFVLNTCCTTYHFPAPWSSH